jgi:hypothetical protein
MLPTRSLNNFNYPQPKLNFHYRGMTPTYNTARRKFSQLCVFLSPEVSSQQQLNRKEKYCHLFAIIDDFTTKTNTFL